MFHMKITGGSMPKAVVLVLGIIVGCGLIRSVHDANANDQADLVRFPSRELELLVGPLTQIGVPNGWEMYDLIQYSVEHLKMSLSGWSDDQGEADQIKW